MSEPTALEIVREQQAWLDGEYAGPLITDVTYRAELRRLHAAVEREAINVDRLIRDLHTEQDRTHRYQERATAAEARAERLESMFWGSFERETCLRNDVRALRDLLSATMAQFVEYNSDRYAVVQMSNDLRDRIDAALREEK